MTHSLAITSLAALQRTIETDKDALRWFTYLIFQPAVRAEISSEQDMAQHYKKLRSLILLQRVILSLLFVFLFVVFYLKRPTYYFFGIAALALIAFLRHETRKSVSKISTCLLMKDFDSSNFSQKTLYQIGEFYARKYGVRSLVAAMSSVDTMVRRTLFYAWVFATIIHPVGFGWFWMLLLGSYLIIYAMIDTSLVYNRIK